MKTYKIYKHANGHREAVKIGWSWPAFFFNLIWAVIKKLWILTGVLLVIGMLIKFITTDLISPYEWYASKFAHNPMYYLTCGMLGVGFNCLLGWKGNQLREIALRKKGYKLISTQMASTPEAALSMYK